MNIFHYIPRRQPVPPFIGTTPEELEAWIDKVLPRLVKLYEKKDGRAMPALARVGFGHLVSEAAQELFEESLAVTPTTVLTRLRTIVAQRRGLA